MWKDLYKKKKRDWKSKDLEPFGDPAIYLRKWISEAFAGIYGGETLLFLWDYCFMHTWSKKIFYKITLVTLMLIRPWAMMAENHRKLSRVLLEEPSEIYINDLRKLLNAFKDLEKEVKTMAEFNTNIEITYVEPEKEPEPEKEEAEVENTEENSGENEGEEKEGENTAEDGGENSEEKNDEKIEVILYDLKLYAFAKN